ncbi:hypothetical protein Taro_042790 [Colocasia esculenta]|uniref:Uncharacterized protein n=1 Tax=Colocasia esculenta TaxID=4460 RepID=A0A843WPS1_COLES|nr:hypothetical protein [Colocasia esculenta]
MAEGGAFMGDTHSTETPSVQEAKTEVGDIEPAASIFGDRRIEDIAYKHIEPFVSSLEEIAPAKGELTDFYTFLSYNSIHCSSEGLRNSQYGVKATCQLSRSPEAPACATRGLAPVGLSEVLSELLRRRCVGCRVPVGNATGMLSHSQAVEGSLRRSGTVERPGARAERRRVRGARRRQPTDREGPFVGWFLRSKLGVTMVGPPALFGAQPVIATGSMFCSEGGTLAVAFGVATGQSSRSTFWGSDDALVAFSPPCRLASGQWPRLGSGLLTLNATGRYVAFRRHTCGRDQVVLDFVLPRGVPTSCSVPCVPALANGPSGVSGKGAVCARACWAFSPFAGAEAGARLASRACGLRVPLLAASGGGLVAVVVTVFSSRRFHVSPVALSLHGGHSLAVPPSQFRSRVPVHGGTGVCGLPTSWRVQGPEWWRHELRALVGVQRVGSLQLVSERGSTENCVRLPCMIRARVAGCSCCCAARVANVVARRVRAVAARLALDSLAVVFPLREPACGVAFTGAELWSVEPSGALVVLVEVLPGPACVVSAVLLAAVFSLMVRVVWSFGLCNLVKVLPRIALVASGGGSPRTALSAFWWRFSPRLLRVVLVVSAWGFSVKVLCAWPCVWLLRWPACLVDHFQVSRLHWRDLRVPMARMVCLIFRAQRALVDGGLVSAVGARLAVLLVEAPVLRCGLPLARGRDSLRCVSPSSVFRWLLEVVILHYGVFRVAMEVVLLALARQGVVVVFAPRAAESVLRCPFDGARVVSSRWCRCVCCTLSVFSDALCFYALRAEAGVACFALFRLAVLRTWLLIGVKATCQLSRSPEAPARATRGLAPVVLSEVLSELLRRRRVGCRVPVGNATGILSHSQAVEGSLRRSGAVERPGARAERRRVRGARRRRPTDREGPFVGWFLRYKSGGDVQPVAFLVATGWPTRSPLRFSSGFCSECGTLAVAFGVATGQSSHSTFWGSDDALVAFSPLCRLAAGQWPRLGSGLLTLNATGRYVAFGSEGGPLVVVTCVPTSRSVPCVPALANGPSGVSGRGAVLSPFLGTPILGSLLREYSGLRVCSSWQPTAFLAQTRQSFVSLPLSALLPEPRSGVRREAAAWPGCGVACVVCFCGGSVSPFAGAEAEARLASRACGLRVRLLAASGGGLVAVVVTAFSSRRFQVSPIALSLHDGHSLAVPRIRGRRWSGLVQTSTFSSSRFGVLLASQFRSRVLVRGGIGVCGLLTSWHVQGPQWFYVWALDHVEV